MSNDLDEKVGEAQQRSYVHCLSNRMVMTGAEFERHFHEIIALRFPQSLIASFMHEATHHATCHTPFWTVLAFTLSEAEKGMLDPNAEESTLSAHAETFLFGYLVHRALSPLLEGMACFAEFDLMPGRSQTVSWPSSLLSTLLVLANLKGTSRGPSVLIDDRGVIVREALKRARLTPAFVDRRTNFLKSAYNPLADTHLFGYVFYKAFWLTACQRTPSFEDPELFLAYVLEHVFADADATATVFSPTVGVDARLQRTLARVQALMRDIACNDQSAAALRLDQRGNGKRAMSKVDLDVEAKMTACLSKALATWNVKNDDRARMRRQARQLAFRDYLSLGAMRVTLSARSPGEAVASNSLGDEVFRATLFGGEKLEGRVAGWIEVVFSASREPALLAAVLSVDGRGPVAASMLVREPNEGELEEALGAYTGSVSSFEIDANAIFELGMINALELLDSDDRKRATERVIQWVDETYCKGIELFEAEPTLWSWRQALGLKDGFAKMLDDDGLQTLAAAGIVDPSTEDQRWLHSFLGPESTKRLDATGRRLHDQLSAEVMTGPPWRSWV